MLKVVLCTISKEHAQNLAQLLVSEKLAACVNIIPFIQSVYSWQDKIQYEDESLLIIKTTENKLKELSGKIAKVHPYSTPEILTLNADFVNQPYFDWVKSYVEEN